MYQLRITLKHLQPAIWRCILVERHISLLRLNHMIQAAMGWKNQHRHEFIIKDIHYGYPDPENFSPEALRDSAKTTVGDVLRRGDAFLYIYDFGDAWEHDVAVEDIIAPKPDLQAPLCLAGARACPPEDCGGVSGYERMCAVLHDPRYEEYAAIQRWLGVEFNTEKFAPHIATRRMRTVRWI